jgi:hypothetical protein
VVPPNRELLGQLLLRPTESLNVETKTWLDPRTSAGVAKLVKALFALRNRNGGTFVMGFNDATLLPAPYNLNGDVKQLFHLDEIQHIVSKYANQVFEIEVQLLPLDGVIYPVIVVPQGVMVPVIVKANLLHEGNPSKPLLAEGDLYFRTLRSNGTPSSAKIRPNDYGELLDICFENREADIGRFLRRHLGGVERDTVLNSLFPPRPDPITSLKTRCDELIKRGDLAFTAANSSGVVTPAPPWVPSHPLTMRVALCIDGTCQRL